MSPSTSFSGFSNAVTMKSQQKSPSGALLQRSPVENVPAVLLLDVRQRLLYAMTLPPVFDPVQDLALFKGKV
jgi:hypothetical protein